MLSEKSKAVATFGAATYSGCLMIVLSGALLRFKDDIDAKGEWNKTSRSSIPTLWRNNRRRCERFPTCG